MQISTETIYKTTHYRSQSVLSHLMAKLLRRGYSLRHSKKHHHKGERGTIKISIYDAQSILRIVVLFATGREIW